MRTGKDPSSRNTVRGPAITLGPTSSGSPPSRISPSSAAPIGRGSTLTPSAGCEIGGAACSLSSFSRPPDSVYVSGGEREESHLDTDSSIRCHFWVSARLLRHTHTIMSPYRPTLNRARSPSWHPFHQHFSSCPGASKDHVGRTPASGQYSMSLCL